MFVVGIIIVERAILFWKIFKKHDHILHRLKTDLYMKKDPNDAFIKSKSDLLVGLSILKFIGALAPMLGLLGTVFGMIDIFESVSLITTSVSPAIISAGLKEALYATAFGLVLFVLSVTGHFIFSKLSENRLRYYGYIIDQYQSTPTAQPSHVLPIKYARFRERMEKVRQPK
jgi:biopolymer transport protein ExbB/TolQ